MNLEELKKSFQEDIGKIKNVLDLENIRVKYLGRKGELTFILRSLKDLSETERRKIGSEANRLKGELEQKINEILIKFHDSRFTFYDSSLDITAPGVKIPVGHYHPITLVQNSVSEIFTSMGFEIVEGPEVETKYYNFDALNIPKYHPARDMQDTFWLKTDHLLRTHTSPVQIRYMETHKPPIRIISPGRVFRREATDATHEAQFYQLEGLMVDNVTNLSNLKAILEVFLKEFFQDKNIGIRFRTSYFPFVEPGIEVDMKFKGKWLEMGGAGMGHPKVLENMKLDSRKFQGFAFGMCIDRLAMLKYKITDIRLFYSGDLRFIKQF